MWNSMEKRFWDLGKAEVELDFRGRWESCRCEGKVSCRTCASEKIDLGQGEGSRNSRTEGTEDNQPTKTFYMTVPDFRN